MRLKLYRAASVSEAMAQVREELGPDALILATRRLGDEVEVTAALEPEETESVPGIVAQQQAAERERLLTWHGVPATLAPLLKGGLLDDALARSLSFTAIDFEARPLLLAGPPGAGKTLTVARLATRLVVAGASPLVITADGRRAGATEQLAAFTRLLGLTLIVASNPVTVARALMRRQPGAPVLIDAPGTDPFDPAERDEVAGLAATAGATTALVLPGGGDAFESADLAAAFAEQGATLLVATRLDLARRLGGVLAAAKTGGLALAEAGIGPGAADGLLPMTPAFLAARLVKAVRPAVTAPAMEPTS
jgi:flagellar biosynthesis protein FlhF